MFRRIADLLNSAGRTLGVVRRRFPEEPILLATAATILETSEDRPTGWSFKRFLQHRGNVVFTEKRVFLQSSFVSWYTLLYVVLIGYFVRDFARSGDTFGAFIVVIAILFLLQRRPYSRDIPYRDIASVKLGKVQGMLGRGDLITLGVAGRGLQIVTAKVLPDSLKQRLGGLP